MKLKTYISACVVAICVAAGACVGYESKTTTTGPTNSGGSGDSTVAALVGTWQSVTAGNIIPSPSSCTDFKWTPTQQSPTSAMGSFSASCAGGLKASGTAAGTLSGTTVTWTGNAVASTPEIPSCNVSLTGTAEL